MYSMNGLKGYYLSKLDLKDNDVVIVTVDTDEADVELYADFFQQISNVVKPHPVLALFKGVKISKATKEETIKLLQNWEEEDVSAS